MEELGKIEKLIEKLKNGSISASEIKELEPYFDTNEPSGDIKDIFIHYWDKSSRYNKDVDLKKMLSAVHRKLDLNSTVKSDTIQLKSLYRYFYTFTRYAAVFVLAFTMAWFILREKTTGESGISDFAKNTSIEVSYGSKSKINLSDGSTVHLNSGSKLIYPTTFEKGKREVRLEGEGYFEVKSDSLNPFFVNTDELTIRVIGTKFNIKSYPGSGTIETTLVTGSLEIINGNEKGKSIEKCESLRLEPNQKAIYIKDRNTLTLEEKRIIASNSTPTLIPKVNLKKNINTAPEIAWKDNMLIFENEKFEDMVVRLERWYNVKINLEITSLKNERFSGKFENETIEQVLKALQLIEVFNYEIIQNKIRIFTN